MLEGDLVRLVPYDPADVSDEHVAWLNDPETFRFLGTKFGQTRTSVRQYVEHFQPPNLFCRILLKQDARHIGNISLHLFDPIHRRMEIAILIGDAEARGKGVGHEACRLIIQHAFDHLNVHKITAGTVAENVGMKKVFLDLGFAIEGTLVEQYFLEGRYHDVLRFGLLRPNFISRAPAAP